MTIPRYVVGTAAEATQILHRLARSGWHPRPGFTVPPSAGPTARIVCYGRIPTQSAAQAAASAAIRGAGVVAIADFAVTARAATHRRARSARPGAAIG